MWALLTRGPMCGIEKKRPPSDLSDGGRRIMVSGSFVAVEQGDVPFLSYADSHWISVEFAKDICLYQPGISL